MLVLLIAASWFLRARFLTVFGNALVEDDGIQKAQAAVVLGGDDWGQRTIKAAQLAQAGYVPYVIVDGPSSLMGHESDVTIEFAKRKGFPGSLFHALPLPNDVSFTRAEAEYVGRYLKTHNIHKILLVTSNFHTSRAARLMRKMNPWLQVSVIAAPDPSFTPDGWWKSRDGQKTFLTEWLKTIGTWAGL